MENKKLPNEKALLSVKEFCDYVGIGKTYAYQVLKDPQCTFSFRIGTRVYANKKKLDERLKYYDSLV